MKICISGYAGSGKTTIANALSLKTNIPVLNITFKDLAKEHGTSLEELQKLAEHDRAIDKKLDELIISEASKMKNVIVSTWLAPWTIKDADIKVFLEASISTRAARVAKRDKFALEEALQHVRERDSQNIQRYKRYYAINIEDKSIFDIIINTDKVTIEEAVEIIKSLIQARGDQK